MKKLLIISLLSLSSSVWANCNNPQNSFEIQKCLSNNLTILKKQLNSTYLKLYNQTDAKKELDAAQKAWLIYREKQCGDFTYADAGAGNGQISYDLSCQNDLTEQRINFLKDQIN